MSFVSFHTILKINRKRTNYKHHLILKLGQINLKSQYPITETRFHLLGEHGYFDLGDGYALKT